MNKIGDFKLSSKIKNRIKSFKDLGKLKLLPVADEVQKDRKLTDAKVAKIKILQKIKKET